MYKYLQAVKHNLFIWVNKDGAYLNSDKAIYQYIKLYHYAIKHNLEFMNKSLMRKTLDSVLSQHTTFNEYMHEILNLFEQNKLSTHCTVEDKIQWYIYFYQEYTTEDVFHEEIRGE